MELDDISLFNEFSIFDSIGSWFSGIKNNVANKWDSALELIGLKVSEEEETKWHKA